MSINTSNRNDTLTDVQANLIAYMRNGIFYLYSKGFVRPLEVKVVKTMDRNNEILLSYGTIKKLRMLPKAWPSISYEALRD